MSVSKRRVGSKFSAIKAKLRKTDKRYVFIAAFVFVGISTLLLTSAASPTAHFEAESGSRTTNATTHTDATASGSSYLKFNAATGGGCSAGQIGTPPNCFPAPPAPAASGKSWSVTYFEEFNGTTLDLTKLSPCFDWNYGGCTSSFNQGKEHYQPSQVRVNNGTAKLVAEPLSPSYPDGACFNGQCTYKAGLLSTARPRADNGSPYLFPYTYGYIESRMKYPDVPGFFTAFWMLPTRTDYDYPYEIDIVEILGGYPETIFMHHHYNNRTSYFRVGEPPGGINNNGACPVKNYALDWVRFGLDWQPNHIAWYIDGVKCGQFNGNTSNIPSEPMQFILHMMIDNSWERSWGSVLANQQLVDQLEVDYIRIYQQQ